MLAIEFLISSMRWSCYWLSSLEVESFSSSSSSFSYSLIVAPASSCSRIMLSYCYCCNRWSLWRWWLRRISCCMNSTSSFFLSRQNWLNFGDRSGFVLLSFTPWTSATPSSSSLLFWAGLDFCFLSHFFRMLRGIRMSLFTLWYKDERSYWLSL